MTGGPGILSLTSAPAQNTTIKASFPAAPPVDNLVVGVVAVKFYQQVNNKFYPLNNGSYNAAAIEFVA